MERDLETPETPREFALMQRIRLLTPNQRYVLWGVVALAILTVAAFLVLGEIGMVALFFSILAALGLVASFIWPPRG